jgi:adenosylmethionine-8-amino-7-oxononanoate aminotransferase
MTEPYNITMYPGTGTVDGVKGDHVIISPAYTVTEAEVDLIVDLASGAIEDAFKSIDEGKNGVKAW